MSAAFDIMTATTQPAPAGAGSKGAAKTGSGGSFASLLETLMALTGQQVQADGMQTTRQSSNTFSMDLAGLLNGNFAAEGEEAGGLTTLLDKLAAALEDAVPLVEDGALPDQAIAGLNAAADALLTLLQPAQANAQSAGALTAGTPGQDLLARFQALVDKLTTVQQPGGAAQPATDLPERAADAAQQTPVPTIAKPSATDLDALLAKLQKLSSELEPKLFQQPAPQQAASTSGSSTETQADPAKAAAAMLAQQQATPKTGQSTQNAASANNDAEAAIDQLVKAAEGDHASEARPDSAPQKDKAPRIVNTAAGLAVMQAAHDDADAPRDPLLLAQTSASNTRVDLAGAPKMGTAPYQNPAPQLNLPGLAFQMVRQFSQGNSRFQIQLDPPEMGRIDVKMDLDGNGGVHARLTVERAETLDLLQRDHRALERALQQAGLDSSKTNLEFSLKQNPFAGQEGGQQQNQPGSFAGALYGDAADEETGPAAPANAAWYRGTASPGGINLLA